MLSVAVGLAAYKLQKLEQRLEEVTAAKKELELELEARVEVCNRSNCSWHALRLGPLASAAFR